MVSAPLKLLRSIESSPGPKPPPVPKKANVIVEVVGVRLANANEPESHGFIEYRIRANASLPDSTPVNNTAYIYFDLNAAVVTNSTLNTMVYVLPVGIAETNSNTGITIYPNPFSNSTTMLFENPNSDNHILIICDLSGKVVAPEMNTRGNMLVIEKNKLTSGIYFYSLINTNTNHRLNGKLLIE